LLTLNGLVVRSQSGFYMVDTDQGRVTCQLRGRIKRGPRTGDLLAIGDRVVLSLQDDNTGMIEEILPRDRMLARLSPTPQGEYRQIIIANPDQAVFVFSCTNPTPHLGMLDRYLVIAEKQQIPALILVNKIDLLDFDPVQAMFEHYIPLGYLIHYTSVKSEVGIPRLYELLQGKVSVFSGPSGVGKSSLLAKLLPGLKTETKEISNITGKGKHATVVRAMHPLPGGGYIADTPGLKALSLWDINPEELDGYFREMRDLVMNCYYSDCTHTHEPGCAVIEAVNQGAISLNRYQSYLHMRIGEGEG
jgi:ribosome biogenesis GTPase